MATGFFGGLAEGLQQGFAIGRTIKKDRREEEEYQTKKQREKDAKETAAEISELKVHRANGTGLFQAFRTDAKSEIAPAPSQPAGLSNIVPPTTSAVPMDTGLEVRPLDSEPTAGGVSLPMSGTQSTPSVPYAERDLSAERRGIQAPAPDMPPQEPVPAAASPEKKEAPVKRENDFFKSSGEGLYSDQRGADQAYYGELERLYTKLYTATQQYDKIPTVQETVKKMKDMDFDPQRKAIGAGIVMGNINSFEAVNRITDAFGLGYKFIKQDNSAFDPKANAATNMTIVTPDGQTLKDQTISVEQALGVLGSFTPEGLLQFVTSRDQTNRKLDQGDRELDIKDADQKSEASYRKVVGDARLQDVANDKQKIRIAEDANKIGKETLALERWVKVRENVFEGIDRDFKVVKDETKLKSPKERAANADNSLLSGYAADVWSVNADHRGYREGVTQSQASAITRSFIEGRLDKSKIKVLEDGYAEYDTGRGKILLPPPPDGVRALIGKKK